ncbi:MAG: hypothetical protein ACRDNF_09525, partial [Streptosporangiaceae bacterium]
MTSSRAARFGSIRRGAPPAFLAGVVSVGLLAALAAPAAPAAAVRHHQAGRATDPAVAGTISTVAGGQGGPAKATKINLLLPCGVSSSGGKMYVSDYIGVSDIAPKTDLLTPFAGTGMSTPFTFGVPATSVGLKANICATTVDRDGNLVMPIPGADGVIAVVAHRTGRFYGQEMTAGDIYKVAGGGDSQRAGTRAKSFYFADPTGVAVDSAGNLVISGQATVWVLAEHPGTFYGQAMTAGRVYPIAGDGFVGYSGDGGPGTKAYVNEPTNVAVDAAGNVLIADTDNNRIRVVAGSTGTFYGQSMTAGYIYTLAGNGHYGFSGDGGPATAAEVYYPQDVTGDAAGNVLIADTGNRRIRVIAATTGTFYGQSMTAGNIYTVAGGGDAGLGDGGPATSAKLYAPDGVAVDGAGDLVIADTSNYRIRVVAATTGTLYEQPMTAGDIYTVGGKGNGFFSVGLRATSAQFTQPETIAVDPAGDLAIADTSQQRIVLVAGSTGTAYGRAMTAGDIYTVAGKGFYGFSGDGGPATAAGLNNPVGVGTDSAGNLVIADSGNNRIRVVARSSGTF